MTDIATKNGSIIVKDGSVAERCECCSSCPCSAMTQLGVTLSWNVSNITAQVLDSCGRSYDAPFNDISMATVYRVPRVSQFPLQTSFGEIASNPPGSCLFYYKDQSISGSTTTIDQGGNQITVQHGLDIYAEIFRPQNPALNNGQEIWGGQVYARVVSRIPCPINTAYASGQQYADGFAVTAGPFSARCPSFEAVVSGVGVVQFQLSGAFGDSYYQWRPITINVSTIE